MRKAVDQAREKFARIKDEYIRSRIKDIEDVTERIIRNLVGSEQESLGSLTERVIIVARDLSPADTSQMRLDRVMGFITDMGPGNSGGGRSGGLHPADQDGRLDHRRRPGRPRHHQS